MSEELERQWDNKHLEPPTKQWNRLSIDKKLQLNIVPLLEKWLKLLLPCPMVFFKRNTLLSLLFTIVESWHLVMTVLMYKPKRGRPPSLRLLLFLPICDSNIGEQKLEIDLFPRVFVKSKLSTVNPQILRWGKWRRDFILHYLLTHSGIRLLSLFQSSKNCLDVRSGRHLTLSWQHFFPCRAVGLKPYIV